MRDYMFDPSIIMDINYLAGPEGRGHLYDPVTMTIVATGVQALGSIREGNAAKAQANYEAGIARQNADRVAQQTAVQSEQQDREQRMRRGANIAAAGGSGVGLDSFGDILQQNAMQERLDILTLESEGLLQQQNFESQASLAKQRGKNAQIGGYVGAASSILGGASKFGGSKLGNQKIEVGDYFSSGARKDISYSKGGGMGPYRF